MSKLYTAEHAKSKGETPPLETWPNQYPGRDYTIEIEIPEFTSMCPRTGQPDFGTIFVDYRPDKECVELKSLKLYIHAFRDMGIFYENVVNKILDDFAAACSPRWIRVAGEFNVRGGMRTRVVAEREKRGQRPAKSVRKRS